RVLRKQSGRRVRGRPLVGRTVERPARVRWPCDGRLVLDRRQRRPRRRGRRLPVRRRRPGRPRRSRGRRCGRPGSRLRARRLAAGRRRRRDRRRARRARRRARRRADRARRAATRRDGGRHGAARDGRRARRGGAGLGPCGRLRRGGRAARARRAAAPARAGALRGTAHAREVKKTILIVVDGMTPAVFEDAVASGRAPALAALAEHGSYRRAVSVFPSLTPVCLSSIVTGTTPREHHIPHLVWWHRAERRLVEYGSSFSALRAAGMAQAITDTIYNMNAQHLSRDVSTLYETLEARGLVTAAVNITCYRGRTKHLPTLPWVTKAAYGPKRFFYYSLFESDRTGAPLAVRNRAGGSIDVYAAAVGRWLVTRDGFDVLAYYLSDFDYASHAHGPEGAADVALDRTDVAIQALVDAAGGLDDFLDRYDVLLLADHGQTPVERAVRLETPLAAHADSVVVAASNRAGQVYLLPDARVDAPGVARALDGAESVEVALWR